jgi:hypothetical protein
LSSNGLRDLVDVPHPAFPQIADFLVNEAVAEIKVAMAQQDRSGLPTGISPLSLRELLVTVERLQKALPVIAWC